MAAVQANVAKGREVELYNRVDSSDPTNSAFIMAVIAAGGDGLTTLQDYDTFTAVFAGASNEVTNAGYARKTLTDADLSAYTVDDTNNWIALTLPLQTFTAITAGDTWDIVMLGYDNDTTGGTDANIIPVSFHELRYLGTAISPNGGNVLIDFSGGWITAT